jgi:cell division protease FtsH
MSSATRPGGEGGGRSRLRWWWPLILLLVVNWVVSSVLLAPPARTTVSYTFFLDQVRARKVATVTSTGEMIQGSFTRPTSYTPEGEPAVQVSRFVTQRPSFADDTLFQQLQNAGAPVNANPPDAGPPLWQQLLLGFGPTLLLVWLLVSLSRRVGGAGDPGGGLGSFGRSRAMLYRPDAGPGATFATSPASTR